MDLKIIALPLIAIALVLLLAALDYHQDFIAAQRWFTNRAALRYCRTMRLRRDCHLQWGIVFALIGGLIWLSEYLL